MYLSDHLRRCGHARFQVAHIVRQVLAAQEGDQNGGDGIGRRLEVQPVSGAAVQVISVAVNEAGAKRPLPAEQNHRVLLVTSPQGLTYDVVADIDAARSTCHLEFYIWESAGRVAEVEAALERAAQRGGRSREAIRSAARRAMSRSESSSKSK